MFKHFSFILVFTITCFAEDLSKINYMIEDDLDNNFEVIQKLSPSLSDDQKFKLFESQKRKITAPILLNMLLIPGVGSAIQKDYVGASIGFFPYMVGWSFLIVRGNLAKPEPYWSTSLEETRYKKAHDDYYSNRRTYLATGVSLMGASWLFSIIKPIVFAKNYNRKLGHALNIANNIQYNAQSNSVEIVFDF